MPRVFVCLAVANTIVLLLTAVLGLVRGAMPVDVHVLVAVFSLLVSCFVQVVVFTYVNVTGKALAQALHLGQMDLGPLRSLRRTKKRMVHAIALVIFAVVSVIATGAIHWQSGEWLALHTVVAISAVVLHVIAFRFEFGLIVQHGMEMARVMEAYERRRATARSTRS